MSDALEQMGYQIAGLTRQVVLLRERVEECERGGSLDRAVLVELCRVKGWTVAEGLGRHRNAAVRALRDSLSAARVGRIFGLTGRRVQQICSNGRDH